MQPLSYLDKTKLTLRSVDVFIITFNIFLLCLRITIVLNYIYFPCVEQTVFWVRVILAKYIYDKKNVSRVRLWLAPNAIAVAPKKMQAVLNQNKLEVLKDNTWNVLLNLTPMPRILLISSQHLARLLSMSPNINKTFWPAASTQTSLRVSITLFLLGWKINRRYICNGVCICSCGHKNV